MKNDIHLKGQLKLYLMWPVIMAILLFIINIWIYTIDKSSGFTMSIFLVVYIVVVVLLYSYSRNYILKELMEVATQYGFVQNELLKDLSIPYAIMLDDGKLVWVNDSFGTLFQDDVIVGKYLSSYIQVLNRSVFPKEEGKKVELEIAYLFDIFSYYLF